MELVDTHCHLTTIPKEDILGVIQRAQQCSVTRFVSIGASDGAASAPLSIEIAESFANIWTTIGIHPHDAKDHTSLDEFGKFLNHPKVVAIGETGLDFFRDWAPRENQEKLFRKTIAVAKEHKKPLVIHCRDAGERTLEMLVECNAKDVGGVFHCYAEDAEYAKKLRDINFLVSFTGNVTFKKAEAIRDAVRNIPLEQMMLETDMPYLAPEPFRGKPSEPMHVYQIALRVAEIKGLNIEEVAKTTTNTALRFFGIQ